jgi:hypothetical protein
VKGETVPSEDKLRDSSENNSPTEIRTEEETPPSMDSTNESSSKQNDLFVTVPLGGFMPPMRSSPGMSPMQRPESVDLSKLLELTENAVRNSKQSLSLLSSPLFQFSHPFFNMAAIAKEGVSSSVLISVGELFSLESRNLSSDGTVSPAAITMTFSTGGWAVSGLCKTMLS